LREKLVGLSPPQIVDLLTWRYQRRLKTMQRLEPNEILEIYLDALARAYDPHSAYLGRQQAQEFEDVLTLSTVGVGGSIAFKNGYWIVAELVPGSPAARSGRLCPGDRILAVAQGDGEFENVTDMPFWRVTDLIRGPKGSTVRLTISPAGMTDDARQTVSLVRDEIKLTEGLANAAVVDWPSGNHTTVRLGIICLPLFYKHSGSNAFGAAVDTFRLIEKFNQEGVKGLILDLRGNPGGSLPEAVRLVGLFISSNPVLQTRDAAGRMEVELSPSCHAIYDGPMVVLTSRLSASAAELVAGALQDYGRALIVGDSSTYGKGTVQDFVPLGQLLHNPNYGAVKVTVAKFYRPCGTSIQLKGIIPDIILPSPTDLLPTGEARWPNALSWDTLPPATYTNCNLVRPVLSILLEKSKARVNSDPGFQLLREELAAASKPAARSTSLNESCRRSDNARAAQFNEQMNNLRRAYLAHRPSMYDISLAEASSACLPPARKPCSSPTVAPAPNTIADDDIELREAESILADYIELLSNAPAETAVKSSSPANRNRFAASHRNSIHSIANTTQ
jgi:carboxyl-terminal processing protease